MPSWSRSTRDLFPPRPERIVKTIRSHTRPERHFQDSLVNLRLIFVRTILVRWLPRCPCCLRDFSPLDRSPSRQVWEQ